ncbi:MAG: hypothetical protein U0457_03925 [Candidatus Sericytochromatia bacterium]
MFFSYKHEIVTHPTLFFPPPSPIIKFYEMDFVTKKVEEVTNKYTKPPYPSEVPTRVYFDKEDNMYLYHDGCCISRTTKEGKYLKTYSLNFFSILWGNKNPIRSRYNFSPSNVVIDEKRKIFYFSDSSAIYKFNI